MNTTRALTIVFAFAACGVAYYLFQNLRTEVVQLEQIEALEERIVDRLKTIRQAQKMYYTRQGTYAGDWDALIRFIKEDSMYITVRNEAVITQDYGADTVIVNIDTTGSISVRQALFESTSSSANLSDLRYVPGLEVDENKEFLLTVGKILSNGILLDAVEVRDPAPANPKRSLKNTARTRQPLHFGSRISVSLSGNWE